MVTMEPMETIHLYYERGEVEPPKLGHDVWIMLFSLLCFVLGVWGICSIAQTPQTITVPAHFLPLQSFSVTEKIIPTGTKIYPATIAHGILTLTNGSVVMQELPQGMLFSGNGVEVTTDEAVIVPAGNVEGFGVATVSAHALTTGAKGNLAPLSINAVYGTSLFIRNLSPFTGGQDAYSVKVVTSQDRQSALDFARSSLTTQVARRRALLERPCKETTHSVGASKMTLTWTCQFIDFPYVPYARITSFTLVGKKFLVDVVFVTRPQTRWHR